VRGINYRSSDCANFVAFYIALWHGKWALSPGQSQLLTVTVQVKNTAPTSSTVQDLLNQVNITSITSDPNSANNANSEPTNLVAFNPALNIVKGATVPGNTADIAGEVV
jgi:hypothetical protein